MFEALLQSYAPLASTALVVVIVLGLAHYLMLVRPGQIGSEAKLPRQLLLLVLTVAALLSLVIVAPLPESTRNQVLALFGVLLSGVIALSSAAFVTNFMAAVMLRVTRPFKVGDFIRVGEFFGKVSERGLFDTEIQTENRELIAIPNATFITQGVTVMRSSGVIVSASVSLGYDSGYSELEPLMLEAAEKAGLKAPYVHISSLGDFAVNYRIAGLLEDIERILTVRSELNRQLLYVLHSAGIEIASPTIARHITQDPATRILPQSRPQSAPSRSAAAEEIVFDKARQTELLEQERETLLVRLAELKASDQPADDQVSLQERMVIIENQLKTLAEES
jgi:small-conductance mechanosensitive channel